MPLVINSLGADTHTYTHARMQTYIHTYRHPHRIYFKKPGRHHPLAGVPSLTMHFVYNSLSVKYNKTLIALLLFCTKCIFSQSLVDGFRNIFSWLLAVALGRPTLD